MKILTKHITFFILFIVLFTSNVSGKTILPESKPKVDEKIRANVRIVGPLPSIMEKKSGVYRWELSIFSKNRSNLHKYLDIMQSRLYDPKLSKQVRWSIDVDPLSSI